VTILNLTILYVCRSKCSYVTLWLSYLSTGLGVTIVLKLRLENYSKILECTSYSRHNKELCSVNFLTKILCICIVFYWYATGVQFLWEWFHLNFLYRYTHCAYVSVRMVCLSWIQNSETWRNTISVRAKIVVILTPRGFLSERNDSAVCRKT
jgi:hypothetical protein